MDASMALVRAALAGGTRTIVATPHVSWDWPDNDADRIAAGVHDVRCALRDAGITVDLLAGAEVALSRAVDLSAAELRALRLGGGPWLLVECPFGPAPGLEHGLGALRMQGHRILLAHPERCPAFQQDPQRLAELVTIGILTAVTAGSFAGRFGRTAERFATTMLRQGLVHAVTSDGHDAVGRPPTLMTDLSSAGLSDQAQRLARDVPRAILDGEQVPGPPAPPASPGIAQRIARRLKPAVR